MRGFLFLCVACAVGCGDGPAVLTQVVEARRLASDLQVQFTKAADASNRAVMAGDAEAAVAAAREASQAKQVVQRDAAALRGTLQELGYREDLQHLEAFAGSFGEYRTLDDRLLPVAIENTNVRAERLSFGPAREAADAFWAALQAAARQATPQYALRVDGIIVRAHVAVLEIQVLHAPHIAGADEAAKSRMEMQMAASEAVARTALETLKGLLPVTASEQMIEAVAALDKFKAIHAEIVTLSRHNSNVRSLAMALGRKRTVTALCDDHLRALEEALAKHEFTATR